MRLQIEQRRGVRAVFENDSEGIEPTGIQYKLVSINCARCGEVHELFEGFGDGALYACGVDVFTVSEGDNINIDFGC